MDQAHLRRYFDTQLAANAREIQNDARRVGRFHVLRRSSAPTHEQLRQRFDGELARPVVERLRPGWTYQAHSSLTEDELFASGLFQRIPLTAFAATARIRGLAHGLPFEMHEVTATGQGERQYLRILLIGFLAHLKLPTPMPGHIRFCHRQPDKNWRRPAMNGYRAVEITGLSGYYNVDATPDAPGPASFSGMVALMDELAKSGWLVHVAFGGLSAWVAVERSRTWFEPRAVPPYSADDVLELENTFSVIERVAAALGAVGRAHEHASVGAGLS